MGSRGSGYESGGGGGSKVKDDEVKKLLENVRKLEEEFEKKEAEHAENRKKNGNGWYESVIPAQDPSKVRITRGSKEKGTYEVKEVLPEEVEDYAPVIKPMKISEEKIAEAFTAVKEALWQKEFKYSEELGNNLRLLAMATNRYKGLDHVSLFGVSGGLAYGLSDDSRREIAKIEKALGVKIL